MQNRYAMRAELRAAFDRAVDQVDGDAALLVRLERYFADLRAPLVELYGADARFEEQWPELLAAIARTAAAREPELRTLDHEREITPDWLHREHAVGGRCPRSRAARAG